MAMRIDSSQKLIVFETCHDSRLLKEWEEGLDANYTKEALINMLMQITATYPEYHFKMSGEAWPLRFDNIFSKYKSLTKKQIAECVAKIYAHPDNRGIILKIMMPPEEMLWHTVMSDMYVSSGVAEEIMGMNVVAATRYTPWGPSKMIPIGRMCWFHTMMCGQWKRTCYFFLPTFTRRMMSPLFGDMAANVCHVAETDGAPATFDGETDTITILPVIFNLYMQGNLEPGRYRIPVTQVSRAARTLKLREFVADTGVKADRNLRAMLLLNAFALSLRGRTARQISDFGAPHDMVRLIADMLDKQPGMFEGVLLHFLDKSTQRLYEGNFIAALTRYVLQNLKQVTAGETISFASLLSRLYAEPGIQNILPLLSIRAMDDNTVSNIRSENPVTPSTAVKEVGVPALLAIVGMLAATGIVAIEYYTPDDEAPSALSGLVSLRLTRLGAYALHLSAEYRAPEVLSPESLFELDSERLLIRALGDINPYEGMVSEFGTDVGARRYLVTAAQMLHGCERSEDIERKIANFRRLVSSEPPRVWEEFFETLLSRAKCFTTDYSRYNIYNVAKDAYDLHDLLATDPELSRMSIRAEGYRILVPSEMDTAFRERLRQRGYLL